MPSWWHDRVNATCDGAMAELRYRGHNGNEEGQNNEVLEEESLIFFPGNKKHVTGGFLQGKQIFNSANEVHAAVYKDLDLPEIFVEVEKRGSSFDKLLTIPEQDDWIYEDGKSVSCVAYVLEIYKAAGLFGPLSSSIQATEFTIKDAYSLKFF